MGSWDLTPDEKTDVVKLPQNGNFNTTKCK